MKLQEVWPSAGITLALFTVTINEQSIPDRLLFTIIYIGLEVVIGAKLNLNKDQ